eukprot:EG_transcript_21749
MALTVRPSGRKRKASESLDHTEQPDGPPCEPAEGPEREPSEAPRPPALAFPARLTGKRPDLLRAVNVFHYAMLNDTARNDFYWAALKEVIRPGSRVLDIGTGSGLLAMMAARLGARWVVTTEGSPDLVPVARRIIAANGLQPRIKVLPKLSTEAQPGDLPAPADVLVFELFGTLLLGESALAYVADARRPARESCRALLQWARRGERGGRQQKLVFVRMWRHQDPTPLGRAHGQKCQGGT